MNKNAYDLNAPSELHSDYLFYCQCFQIFVCHEGLTSKEQRKNTSDNSFLFFFSNGKLQLNPRLCSTSSTILELLDGQAAEGSCPISWSSPFKFSVTLNFKIS